MTFPLVPRGRLVGLSFGTMRSLRRGSGSDVAGSHPYRPGDDVHAIDWAATARLSSARATDEFVVRELYADEAPRVVTIYDRRPEMAFFSPPLPWLDKALAMRHVLELVRRSALVAGGFVGHLDFSGGEPSWEPPRGRRGGGDDAGAPAFAAPPDALDRAFEYVGGRRRSVTPGSFVFVLSDFVPPPSAQAWQTAREHRWDVVPVVIQDPVWEQSFPDVSGIVVPLRDPRTGRVAPVRVTRREADERRDANEARLRALLAGFAEVGADPVLVSSSDRVEILVAFLQWAELRRTRRAR